jgi:hypothetical protein
MIDRSILDETFSALSEAKTAFSEVQLTLHEDGYHSYAGRISDLRLKVEDIESATADLLEAMEKGAQ